MYLVYIDEAGTNDLKKEEDIPLNGGNSRYFTLGAVFIHTTDLEVVENSINIYKEEFLKHPYAEIKCNMRKSLKKEYSKEVASDEIYSLITGHNINCFGVTIDKYDAYTSKAVSSKNDIYVMVFQHLLYLINKTINTSKITEPITLFIDRKEQAHNRLIYESYKEALKSESEHLRTFNGKYFSPSINIVESEFTLGVQLADLVAGALWRGTEYQDKKYSKMLLDKFPKDKSGSVIDYSFRLCNNWL